MCLFAAAKEIVGEPRINVELEIPATLGDLKAVLAEQFPALDELMKISSFSVDQQYAVDTQVLSEGVEVALIPPVSGG